MKLERGRGKGEYEQGKGRRGVTEMELCHSGQVIAQGCEGSLQVKLKAGS